MLDEEHVEVGEADGGLDRGVDHLLVRLAPRLGALHVHLAQRRDDRVEVVVERRLEGLRLGGRQQHEELALRLHRAEQLPEAPRARERPRVPPRREDEARGADALDRLLEGGLPPELRQRGRVVLVVGEEVEPEVDLLGLVLLRRVRLEGVEREVELVRPRVRAEDGGGRHVRPAPHVARLQVAEARGERAGEAPRERHQDALARLRGGLVADLQPEVPPEGADAGEAHSVHGEWWQHGQLVGGMHAGLVAALELHAPRAGRHEVEHRASERLSACNLQRELERGREELQGLPVVLPAQGQAWG